MFILAEAESDVSTIFAVALLVLFVVTILMPFYVIGIYRQTKDILEAQNRIIEIIWEMKGKLNGEDVNQAPSKEDAQLLDAYAKVAESRRRG